MEDVKHERIGVAYIRESTEEQDKGFSPQNQERSIREYAEKHHIKIARVYKDLRSGTTATKRNEFQEMIQDAIQKKFDAILVYHTSRFTRNVREARQYKDLLRKKLGIDVISVVQHFGSHENPSSFLNEGVNELFDEYYSRQLSFWVRHSLMEKRRQGKPIGGHPPYGYRRHKVGYDKTKERPIYSQEWETDPEAAKVIRKMFKMYATGRHSFADIAKALNEAGHRTSGGNQFTYSSIKCTIQNKTYIGLIYSPRKDLPDLKSTVHERIISDELFEKCQEVIRERRRSCGRPPSKHRHYLLQGLVYCDRCRKKLDEKSEASPIRRMQPSMYCETHIWKKRERKFYSCKFRKENQSCKQSSVESKMIDDQVIEYMGGFNLPEDIIQKTLTKLRENFDMIEESSTDDERLRELEKRKKKLKFLFLNEDMKEDDYLLEKSHIKEEEEALRQRGAMKSMTRKQQELFLKRTEVFLRDFPAFWDSDITELERREWIQLVIKRVWVRDQQVVAIEPRDEYKRLFKSHRKVIDQFPVVAPVESSPEKQSVSLCFSFAPLTEIYFWDTKGYMCP